MKKMWRDPEAVEHTAPLDVEARFLLRHKGTTIGTLALSQGEWTFSYSDEFKSGSSLRTITEFPDVDRTYVSRELWPFFLMRIPSLRRTAIRDIIAKEQIDEHDEAELLKRFGRETIANPFELVASD
jgi:HipA-like protein